MTEIIPDADLSHGWRIQNFNTRRLKRGAWDILPDPINDPPRSPDQKFWDEWMEKNTSTDDNIRPTTGTDMNTTVPWVEPNPYWRGPYCPCCGRPWGHYVPHYPDPPYYPYQPWRVMPWDQGVWTWANTATVTKAGV